MDAQTLHSGIYYLLGIWGVLTAILVVLLIYRSALTNREDDQLFLDQAGEGMAAEQRVIVSRIEGLARPIMILYWISGTLLIALAAMWVWANWAAAASS